jgi:hypothetical protein
MAQPDRRYACLCERCASPAWIRRDCEGRFRGLAPDVTATAMMIVPQLPKFPPPSAPSTFLGNPATSAAPTAPSTATSSNPKTRPIPRSGKDLGPNASLRIGPHLAPNAQPVSGHSKPATFWNRKQLLRTRGCGTNEAYSKQSTYLLLRSGCSGWFWGWR